MKCFWLLFLFFLSVAPLRAESITYDIKKWGISIGQATLTFAGESDFEGQRLTTILFKADGFNFYDEEKIYLDPGTLCPVVVLRDFNLNVFGNGRIREDYLPGEGKIKISKEAGGKKTMQVLEKSGATDNIYGFIYRYRKNGSFRIGEVLDVHLPTKDLKIELAKRAVLDQAGKRYDTFFMQSKPAKYKIWFDASDKKLPLRISGAIGLANTVMVMTGYRPAASVNTDGRGPDKMGHLGGE